MKRNPLIFIAALTLLLSSCASSKKPDSSKFFNTTWELEYISGPRIAFDGLFPEKKPQISFNKAANKVSGNASCNGYSASYTLQDNTISFGEPEPTTMMYCGDGEQQFLNMMEKINKYSFDKEGKLNLMIDEVPMLRFKKTTQ